MLRFSISALPCLHILWSLTFSNSENILNFTTHLIFSKIGTPLWMLPQYSPVSTSFSWAPSPSLSPRVPASRQAAHVSPASREEHRFHPVRPWEGQPSRRQTPGVVSTPPTLYPSPGLVGSGHGFPFHPAFFSPCFLHSTISPLSDAWLSSVDRGLNALADIATVWRVTVACRPWT